MSQVGANAAGADARDASSTQDAVASLAIAAARGERRNRPTFLVVAGAAALVAGLVYAGLGLARYGRAQVQAMAAKSQSEQVLSKAAELKALMESDGAGGAARGVEPAATNVLSRIEAAGTQAGLSKPVPIGSRTVTPNREIGWNQVRYSYNVKDVSLDALLRWAQLVLDDVGGLEVYSVTLRPEATEWSLTIVFMKWEKPEGT